MKSHFHKVHGSGPVTFLKIKITHLRGNKSFLMIARCAFFLILSRDHGNSKR